ncbi:cobalt-precorrin-7 (C(5))-methyltransferase [Vulcanisaeta sp. JCM 14467]|uniref:cobalt-precorrin-7 (C(5))-methyltransferase n=1 Tax=Vulcanisaeta sp. JCM 14467 TaxID=1295370 RepID=UPI0006D05F6C|nr:cobalt-precorrin-7 (C(5))-methyltransferase [Vulcanisaeta sp. JCM 14467]
MVIYVVGVGPGDPEYLTLRGYRVIRECGVVAGWRSVVERFMPLLVGKRVVVLSYGDEEEKLAELAEVGRSVDVAVLVHGDPSVSDWQFIEKIRRVARDRGVGVEVVPGVSSLNVLLARLGLDMAFVGFVTLHVRGDLSRMLSDLLAILRMGRVAVVIPEPRGDGPQRVARFLRENGLECSVVVFERLTYGDERVRYYEDLDSLISEDREFGDLVIMAVFPRQSRPELGAVLVRQ